MERRHRGDSALGRDVFEFVDVDLDEFNFRVLGRQFLEERRDGLARSAPARGEINDDLFRATRVRGVTSSVFARLASVFARRSIDRRRATRSNASFQTRGARARRRASTRDDDAHVSDPRARASLDERRVARVDRAFAFRDGAECDRVAVDVDSRAIARRRTHRFTGRFNGGEFFRAGDLLDHGACANVRRRGALGFVDEPRNDAAGNTSAYDVTSNTSNKQI